MNEYSRIILEEYCMAHSNTKKSKFIRELVEMSYDVCCMPEDWQAVQLEEYIERERNPQIREALDDLDEFLFRF